MIKSDLPLTADSIEPYLQKFVPDATILFLQKFNSGQSNPTYLIETTAGKYVIRTKPSGILLPSAHLVEREFRVMNSIADTEVPVPKVFGLVEDCESPIGRAFFIMENVDGRVYFDPTLPNLSREARKSIYDQMNQVLVNLHELNIVELGLDRFAKPGNYFLRQIEIWSRQYMQVRTKTELNLEKLIDWLFRHCPEIQEDRTLIHGDFRLDNIIFKHDNLKALALVDWELSTLGYPIADLAYQCAQWRMPYDSGLKGLGGIDRKCLGIPTEAEYVELYCHRRSMPFPDNWNYCLAFNLFRLAAILEGVARRAIDGNASNPELAMKFGASVPKLAEMALDIVETK